MSYAIHDVEVLGKECKIVVVGYCRCWLLSGEQLSGEQLSGEQLSDEQLSGEQLSGEQLSSEQLSVHHIHSALLSN